MSNETSNDKNFNVNEKGRLGSKANHENHTKDVTKIASRFLNMFKLFLPITIEVKKPEKQPSFNRKVMYTLMALLLYLIMLSVPVYGPGDLSQQEDPFFALRTILASQRGTLAELGIGPIVTAGMILQLLVGSRIINVDFQDSEERALYTVSQKIMAILMTVFEAIAYISGGAYGDAVKKDLGIQTIIVIQLTLAGLAIMLMDELVQKGYGLGSGISLFIAASVSFQVVRGMLSLNDVTDTTCPTLDTDRAACQYRQGALIFFFQALIRGNVFRGLWHPDIPNSPDMFNVFATILVFGVVIYFETMKIEIPVQHAEYKMPARYPIKFLYVSNIPVILVSALFANIYLVSRLMNNKYGAENSPMGTLARFLGTWGTTDAGGGQQQQVPTGGLAALTTPPRGILDVIENPFQAIGYLILMVVLSTAFAMVWVETAGMSARNVAEQLIGADMQIPGFRRNPKSIEKYLNNYIPYAAFLGGVFIGLLAAIADFLGAVGTGTGILLTTGIIRQYYEIIAKEKISEINPNLANLLGL